MNVHSTFTAAYIHTYIDSYLHTCTHKALISDKLYVLGSLALLTAGPLIYGVLFFFCQKQIYALRLDLVQLRIWRMAYVVWNVYCLLLPLRAASCNAYGRVETNRAELSRFPYRVGARTHLSTLFDLLTPLAKCSRIF